jgi:predicted acetyltransferase
LAKAKHIITCKLFSCNSLPEINLYDNIIAASLKGRFDKIFKGLFGFGKGEIKLSLSGVYSEDTYIGAENIIKYDVRLRRRKVGYVTIRIGESPQLFYLGHIGYRINEPFRGNGYAAKAVELLIPIIRRLGYKSMVITTDEDNIPSRKTCEKLGCVLEQIVKVPNMFLDLCMGSKTKCRYILII